MPDTWYVRRDGRSEGPFTAAELKKRAETGEVAADTVVSPDGTEWVRAADVTGLLARPVLELADVVKGFGNGSGPVLHVRDFALRAGEQIALAGASGSGKTTLLNLLAGLTDPDRGEVRIDGTAINALSGAARDRFRGRKIGMVFQTFNLIQGLSAENNVLLAMMFGGLPAAEHKPRAAELLSRVGLSPAEAARRPAELSIGQQQRVAVARALANRPTLVLADEPAANLDRDNARRVADLLKEVCSEGGQTLIVVAHDAVLLGAFSRVEDIARFKP
jgi:putative ABC transport system ATP-binding protein